MLRSPEKYDGAAEQHVQLRVGPPPGPRKRRTEPHEAHRHPAPVPPARAPIAVGDVQARVMDLSRQVAGHGRDVRQKRQLEFEEVDAMMPELAALAEERRAKAAAYMAARQERFKPVRAPARATTPQMVREEEEERRRAAKESQEHRARLHAEMGKASRAFLLLCSLSLIDFRLSLSLSLFLQTHSHHHHSD